MISLRVSERGKRSTHKSSTSLRDMRWNPSSNRGGNSSLLYTFCASGNPCRTAHFTMPSLWIGGIRIIQRKMILKASSIPMQDDTESWDSGVGHPRLSARTYAERRDSESGPDFRVSEVGGNDLVCRPKPGRKVRLGATIVGGAGVRQPRQKRAWTHPRLPEQGDRIERATNGAAHSDVPGNGSGGVEAAVAARVQPHLHRCRHRAAGRSGPGARTDEWTGDPVDSTAGVRAVREAGVCAAGGHLGGASVQLAQQRELSQTGGSVGTDTTDGSVHWGTPETGSARGVPDFCGSTRCIKAIGREPRGCITSTPWTA